MDAGTAMRMASRVRPDWLAGQSALSTAGPAAHRLTHQRTLVLDVRVGLRLPRGDLGRAVHHEAAALEAPSGERLGQGLRVVELGGQLGQHHRVLDRHAHPEGQVRRRRVRGVADQQGAAAMPWRRHEQVGDRALVDLGGVVEALEHGCDVAADAGQLGAQRGGALGDGRAVRAGVGLQQPQVDEAVRQRHEPEVAEPAVDHRVAGQLRRSRGGGAPDALAVGLGLQAPPNTSARVAEWAPSATTSRSAVTGRRPTAWRRRRRAADRGDRRAQAHGTPASTAAAPVRMSCSVARARATAGGSPGSLTCICWQHRDDLAGRGGDVDLVVGVARRRRPRPSGPGCASPATAGSGSAARSRPGASRSGPRRSARRCRGAPARSPRSGRQALRRRSAPARSRVVVLEQVLDEDGDAARPGPRAGRRGRRRRRPRRRAARRHRPRRCARRRPRRPAAHPSASTGT